jgi:hypothetical protein
MVRGGSQVLPNGDDRNANARKISKHRGDFLIGLTHADHEP